MVVGDGVAVGVRVSVGGSVPVGVRVVVGVDVAVGEADGVTVAIGGGTARAPGQKPVLNWEAALLDSPTAGWPMLPCTA